MTPEERAAFEERMAARRNGQGGFGGGQGQGGFGGGQGQAAGGRGGFPGGGQPRANGTPNAAPSAGATQSATRSSNVGRVASAPTMTTGATTIDSLFGPLPAVETRGQAWLWENKQLKQVRLRLGVSDGTFTEVIQSDPEVKEGTEVVTNVIIEQATTTPGANNANKPLMGPQRGRPGGPGGGFGGGGGGRGGR
jgi:hypothetical protein